jgi:hypothetical protein
MIFWNLDPEKSVVVVVLNTNVLGADAFPTVIELRVAELPRAVLSDLKSYWK